MFAELFFSVFVIVCTGAYFCVYVSFWVCFSAQISCCVSVKRMIHDVVPISVYVVACMMLMGMVG